MLIMLALAITFLVHPGPGSTYVAPLRPSLSPHHFGGILAGMVFSILALSGFEAPAPLAQESPPAGQVHRPGRHALAGGHRDLLHLHIVCERDRLGHGRHGCLRLQPESLLCSRSRTVGSGWWLVILAIINSAVGVGLACTNAASRVMYTMGQAGTLPARFGTIHPVHRTPTFAIAFLQVSGIVGGLARRSAVAARRHLRLPRNHCYAGRNRPLLHGEPGSDVLHPPRASG